MILTIQNPCCHCCWMMLSTMLLLMQGCCYDRLRAISPNTSHQGVTIILMYTRTSRAAPQPLPFLQCIYGRRNGHKCDLVAANNEKHCKSAMPWGSSGDCWTNAAIFYNTIQSLEAVISLILLTHNCNCHRHVTATWTSASNADRNLGNYRTLTAIWLGCTCQITAVSGVLRLITILYLLYTVQDARGEMVDTST